MDRKLEYRHTEGQKGQEFFMLVTNLTLGFYFIVGQFGLENGQQ